MKAIEYLQTEGVFRHAAFACLLQVALALRLQAERTEVKGPYAPTWESVKTHAIPQWFDEAKFGIFVHWGPQSLWGSPWNAYQNPARYYPTLRKRFGAAPPEFGYKDVVPLFKAEKWEPEVWAALFQKAGAKYVILTGEHHDGYQLGDSKLTDWCAAKMGPRRDLIADLGRAVRARGMKFAPSYHRERHAGMFSERKFVEKSPPCKDIAEEIQRDPKAERLYGPFEYSDAFIADYVARWKEWEERYQPDMLWIDDIPFFYTDPNSPQVAKYRDACLRMICDYYNAAERWGKQVCVNNKGRRYPNWPDGVGFRESDRMNLEEVGVVKWQCPMTLGNTWFYSAEEEKNDAYKTATQLIHLLCDVVSKNGNLCLNVGPRADGTIPEGMQKRLLAVGDWLRVNGEAIYGTRPWQVFGEGSATPSTEKPEQRGDKKITRQGFSATDIRFTTQGDTLYAIVLGWPKDGTVRVRSLAKGKGPTAIGSVRLLGHNSELAFTRDEACLTVALPEKRPCEHAFVLRIGQENSKLSQEEER